MADSIYDRSVALTRKNYADTLADLQRQRQSAQQSYGFDDTSNPYSQAKLLERSYKENVARSTNSYASQGQLYSGALQRAQGQNAFGYNQQLDSARRQYQDLIGTLGFQEAQAGTQEQQGILGADEASLARMQAQEPVDPGLPPGVAPTAPGASPSRKNLTPEQRRQLARRTTASSKKRYLEKYGY